MYFIYYGWHSDEPCAYICPVDPLNRIEGYSKWDWVNGTNLLLKFSLDNNRLAQTLLLWGQNWGHK